MAANTPHGAAAHAIRRCTGGALNTHCTSLDGPGRWALTIGRFIVDGGDQIPLRGVVWCEADRVAVGLVARDSETARDEEHGHGKPPSFELIDETKSAFPQRLWRE
jgi:hypothetical protein